jgi:hypothetical protein
MAALQQLRLREDISKGRGLSLRKEEKKPAEVPPATA